MRSLPALAVLLAALPASAAVVSSGGPGRAAVPPQLAGALELALGVAPVPGSAAALPAPGEVPALPEARAALSVSPAGSEARMAAFVERLRSLPAAPEAAPAGPSPEAAGLIRGAAAALEGLSPDQIRALPEADLAAVSRRIWDAGAAFGRDAALLGPGPFDPAQGLADIERLEALNEELASGRLAPAELEARGILRRGSERVTRGRPQDRGGDQLMPFRELFLPAARTGLYAPTKLGPLKDYQGLLVLMPGIGADISTAKTVLDLALTFSKAKKDPVLDEVGGRRLRLVSFALDSTLNGLGEDAPFSFASARGSAAVLRHAILVLKLLYPGLPVFAAGRSQGGLIALEYASRHDEAAGVVALNPSHPDPAIVAESVRIHEGGARIFGAQDFSFHQRSWTAYKHFTPGFETLERPSRVPVLLQLGANDPSYPQPAYVESYRGFAARQPGGRRAEVLDLPAGQSHNLWNRSNEGVYRRALAAMARFFAEAL